MNARGPGRFRRVVAALLGVAAAVGLWATLRPTPSDLALRIVATYLAAWGLLLALARRSRGEWLKRSILMTGAIGLTLALIELPAAVGLVDYERLFPANRIRPTLGRRDTPDPELGLRHPPHSREVGMTQGDIVIETFTRIPWAPWYRYDVGYDARGFRNAADLDRADIAVIGDSFVEGVQVPSDDLMTTVLGRRLGATVVNLGKGGYGPRSELTVLGRFAVPLRPRVCVWAFFEGNDLSDIRRFDLWKEGGAAASERRTMGDRSFARNALLALIRVAGLDRSRYDDFLRKSGLFRMPDGRDVRLFFHYPGQPLSAEDRGSLEVFAQLLAEARATCQAHQIRLVVLFMPTKFRVYGDRCRFAPDSPCATWSSNDLPDRLRDVVAGVSPSIGYVDLTGPFREEAGRGPLLYYPDDTHWSPEGQELAGRLVADALAGLDRGR